MPRLLPVLILCLGLPMASPSAAQNVRRCTNTDGGTVFTDRQCTEIGAIEQRRIVAPADVNPSRARPYGNGCPHRLSDLVQQITSSIASRDVNGLASIYAWNGLSSGGSERILTRLEAIVQRPLVAILPVRPGTPVTAADAETGTPEAPLDTYAEPAARAPHPIGLRLEQTLPDGRTPSHTVLGLHRRYQCFWISL